MRLRFILQRTLLALTVVSFCSMGTMIAAAQSTVVPGMTGVFGGGEWDTQGWKGGGDNFFFINFYPVVDELTWDWFCPDQYGCWGTAFANITGGTADGVLYGNYSTANPFVIATFSGSVTGGYVYDQRFTGEYGWWWNQNWYTFEGTWSNGFRTTGSAYTEAADDAYPAGDYTMTTTTPEPSTLGLVGIGFVGLCSRIRRKT